MDCNNEKCLWHYDGQCVCESPEAFTEGRPNSMNCSYFLINEFERELINDLNACLCYVEDIKDLLHKSNRHKMRKNKMLLEKLIESMKGQ